MGRRSAQCCLVLFNRVCRAAQRHVNGAALQRRGGQFELRPQGWLGSTAPGRFVTGQHPRHAAGLLCAAQCGARSPHLDARVGPGRLQLQRARVGLERRGEATQVLVAGGQALPGSCKRRVGLSVVKRGKRGSSRGREEDGRLRNIACHTGCLRLTLPAHLHRARPS